MTATETLSFRQFCEIFAILVPSLVSSISKIEV